MSEIYAGIRAHVEEPGELLVELDVAAFLDDDEIVTFVDETTTFVGTCPLKELRLFVAATGPSDRAALRMSCGGGAAIMTISRDAVSVLADEIG